MRSSLSRVHFRSIYSNCENEKYIYINIYIEIEMDLIHNNRHAQNIDCHGSLVKQVS